MTDPIRAEDVLQAKADKLRRLRRNPKADGEAYRDALLAQTPIDQPVVLMPDGTLRGLEWRAHESHKGDLAPPSRLTVEDLRTGNVANPNWTTLYRLTEPGEST